MRGLSAISLRPDKIAHTKMFSRHFQQLIDDILECVNTVPEHSGDGVALASRIMRKLTNVSMGYSAAVKMEDPKESRLYWRLLLADCRSIRDDIHSAIIHNLIPEGAGRKIVRSLSYIQDVLHLAAYYDD